MKNKILTCVLLLAMIGSITGCQKAGEETGSTDADMQMEEEIVNEDIDEQAVEEIETRENADGESEEKPEEDQSLETESSLNDTAENREEKIYHIKEYGTVEEKLQEYLVDDSGNMSYYYQMENFFVHDTFPNAASINHTLQMIYDEYEKIYMEEAAEYEYEEERPTPYDYWHILSITYIGDDYISILYNDIYYASGAHPYSRFDGITIDCRTGEQVSASQLLEKSDEQILTEISNTMGFELIATWDDVDFYLTDSSIVFFYRVPNIWEDVVLSRES